jgi:hypothetical protein
MKVRKLPLYIRLQEWWFYKVRFPFIMWWHGVTLKQIQKRNDRIEKLYRVLKLIENETPKSIRKPDRKKN